MKKEFLSEVSSTNDYIRKYLKDGQDIIVCAARQSGGKGTKGRSFSSEIGGVYLTMLKFYEDLPASQAFRVMAHAAVSVCRTVESFGAKPEIKWANDVFVSGRKICGILIENILEESRVRASIVGIGLNVSNDLSGLEERAISLSQEVQPCPETKIVRDRLIECLEQSYDFKEYRSYIKFLGKNITVFEGGREFQATAREILSDGRLKIEQDGKMRVLSAAEISIGL